MAESTSKTEKADLGQAVSALKKDLGELARSVKDQAKSQVECCTEWAKEHSAPTLGIVAGVAASVGFLVGFLVGRSRH